MQISAINSLSDVSFTKKAPKAKDKAQTVPMETPVDTFVKSAKPAEAADKAETSEEK